MGDIKFTIINEWEGGIPGGSLCFSDNKYLVRFQDGSRKTFNERQEAENFRRLQSLEKGLTRNQYRVIECDIEGEYIEMKLQDNYITKFDIEDLKFTQKYSWYAKKDKAHRCYVHQSGRKNEKYKLFHRIIFPEWTQIDHINRDGLDNRRKNLRPVSTAENNINQKKRTDNVSGKTGIHFCNHSKCWIVQWPEDGKRKKKSFSESKYGYDGAKLMALNHRQKMDIKNNLMNGYESDENTKVAIEPISLDKVVVKKNLLSTNKSGKEGVYFVKAYNFWGTDYKDENGKKKCKRFYVGKKRTYEEAKKLAMQFVYK